MADFRYRPLDSQTPCFRLLKLLKGDTIEIECEILHDSISEHDAIPYEALSYAWGSTELVVCIKVDGKRLWITENLYTALQCLRYRDLDRVLWIDAICINQFDLEERSQQVRKMGMIFGSAQRVIFWLGRPTVEAALLFDFLAESERQRRSEPRTYEGDTVDNIPSNNALSGMQPTSKLQDYSLVCQQRQRERDGLKFLLQRPWFGRVWILQEVVNAQSAIVCSGTLSISAHTFALAPFLLDLNTDIRVQSILEIMPGPYRATSWWSQEGERDLFNLLVKFRDSQATDMRDTIFALLGMSSESTHHHLLCADYTKPLEQVLHDAIRYWSRSPTILVEQVFDFLTAFKTIHVTYLIPPERYKIDSKISPYQSAIDESVSDINAVTERENVECLRNAGLFLLEQHRGEVSRDIDACYEELEEFEWLLHQSEAAKMFQIVSWKSKEANVRFLIVKEAIKALLQFGKYDCWHTFEFVVDHCTDDRQKLLEDTLCAALDEYQWYMVELLVVKGADVNALGGRTLHMASAAGHEKLVQILLDKGADVHAQGPHIDALVAASAAGYEKVVQMLLEKGADSIVRGERYGNALRAAAERGHKKVVRVLLNDVTDIFHQGGEALYKAVACGHEEIVQMLLDKGAKVHSQCGNALVAASSGGHAEIVQMLLNKGADVNAKDEPYGDALVAALVCGHRRIVQILLGKGADIYATGVEHDNALQAVLEYGVSIEAIAKALEVQPHGDQLMQQIQHMHGLVWIMSDLEKLRALRSHDWAYLAQRIFKSGTRWLAYIKRADVYFDESSVS